MKIIIAEFIGTMLLILLGNGVVANVLLNKSKGQNSGWIVISAGWGFAVAIGVYASAWISGAHLNPAITLGFAILGKTPWAITPLYLIGQFLGAFFGAVLVWLSYYSHWKVTQDKTHKLLAFATKPAINHKFWNFMTEVIGTTVLLLGVLTIFDPHTEMSPSFGPYAVGILVFSIGLSLGGPTGYAINPARDFAPRLAHTLLPIAGKGSSDWSYAWIPILGPLVGAILGVLAYKLLVTSFFV